MIYINNIFVQIAHEAIANSASSASFYGYKILKTRPLIIAFLCGQMSVQFESGTWVKVNCQEIPMVPISTNFDTGKTVYFTF